MMRPAAFTADRMSISRKDPPSRTIQTCITRMVLINRGRRMMIHMSRRKHPLKRSTATIIHTHPTASIPALHMVILQEPESEYGPYSYGNYSQSTRRKKPIALAAAAVAAVIIAALLPTILHNRADAGGLPTVSYSYETPVVPTHAVQTQAPVSAATPTPTKEPAQSTALPAVGLSADDTPYLYYRGLLSPENQTAYDIIAAGIAVRQDSIELDLKDISEINTIYTYLSRDRTDLFWWNSWSSSYYEENGSYRVVLSPTYIDTPQEIEDRASKIERICSEVINNARFSSDYEKVKADHDFIINQTIHDLSDHGTYISFFFMDGRSV